MRTLLQKKIRESRKQSGIALLTVLVALMIISIMLMEFQYSAMVERKLAYNDLNQLQAYYLAKSGIHMGLLRVALYGRARRSPQLSNLAPGVDIKPYLEPIWNLTLPAFPPETGSVTKLEKADKDAAEKTLSETKVTEGSVSHVITSEASKINLNMLVVPGTLLGQKINFSDTSLTGPFVPVARMLINLLNGFLLQSDNPAEEYNNMKPEEIVYNIMDWINTGNDSFRGGNKDGFYEQQNPPYKAKRNRFYTVDELKMVRDIDDHLFNKLKPYVTVYSDDGKININTAGKDIYKALYQDFTDDDLKRILDQRAQQQDGAWPNVKAFTDFATGLRPGFGTAYPDPTSIFTVGSQSFLIESLAIINRSGSSIQKVIRVAVALTAAKGGSVDPNFTTQNSCASAPDHFWDVRMITMSHKASHR